MLSEEVHRALTISFLCFSAAELRNVKIMGACSVGVEIIGDEHLTTQGGGLRGAGLTEGMAGVSP